MAIRALADTGPDVHVTLTGPGGCLGCAAIIALPAYLFWKLKRQLLGRTQADLGRVWTFEDQSAAQLPGFRDLMANDPAFAIPAFAARVEKAFALLLRSEPDNHAWVADPSVLAAIHQRPRHAVIRRGRITGIRSSGGQDQIQVYLAGTVNFGLVGWSDWEEEWTFLRLTPQPRTEPKSAGDCSVCGAPLELTPDYRCRFCQSPAAGIIDTWRLMSRDVLASPVFR